MNRKEDIRRQIEEVRKMGEDLCELNEEDVNGDMHKAFETQYNQVLVKSEEERKQAEKEHEAHIKELEEKTNEHRKELEATMKELQESRKDSEVKRKKYDEMNQQLQQLKEKTVEEEVSKLMTVISEECIDKNCTLSPELIATLESLKQALRREHESQRCKPEERERLSKLQTGTLVFEHDQMFGHRKDSVKVKLDVLTLLKQELAAKDEELEVLRSKMLDNNKLVKQLKEDLARKEDEMVQKGKLDEQRKDILNVVQTDMKECLGRKDVEIKNMAAEREKMNGLIQKLEEDLTTRDDELHNIKREMCEKDRQMQEILRQKDDQLAQLKNELDTKEGRLGELINTEHTNAELRNKVAELERTNAGGATGGELRAIMKKLTDLANKANDSFRQMSRTMVIIHPVHSNTQQILQVVEHLNRQVDALVIEHPQVLDGPIEASATASPTVANQPSSAPPSCGLVCARCERADFPDSSEGRAMLETHLIECLRPDSAHGLQPVQCSDHGDDE